MNQSMYYKSVCTTAPDTPGVLNTTVHSLHPSGVDTVEIFWKV